MKYLLGVVFVFVVLINYAQKDTDDAVYENILIEYTLNLDGSIDYHYYKKMKYLSHYSFNRLFGETFIVYNPKYQNLTINQSFTTQESGNIVQTPDNAFNELLPRFAANSPWFNHLREMAVTHTGLEIGAVVELDYTIHSEAGYFPALMGNELITESVMVKEKVIKIKMPSDQELNYKVFNIRTGPEVRDKKGVKTYTFTFKGISEHSHESFQPKNDTDLPRLTFSTALMSEVYNDLIRQEAFNYEVNKRILGEIEKIKKDNLYDVMVALKLQELVVNEFNFYNIPLEHAAYLTRASIDTWNSNGGTKFEKSILLTALLLEAGISAKPVIVIPSKFYDENIGCLPIITDIIVQVNPRDTEQLYLSATNISDQNKIYALENSTVITLDPAQPLRIENIIKNENSVNMTGNLVLSDSLKITGDLEITLFNNTNPYFKLKQDSSHAKKVISGGLSAKDIKEFKIMNSAQTRSIIDFKIDSKEPIKNQANYYFMQIPNCNKGIQTWHMNYLIDKRDKSLEVPFTLFESYELTITVPDSLKLIGHPEKIVRQADFGKLSIEIVQVGNKINIIRKVEINQQTIPMSSYKDFKEMIDLWNEKKYKELVLKY